jgi:hypothetical protein
LSGAAEVLFLSADGFRQMMGSEDLPGRVAVREGG